MIQKVDEDDKAFIRKIYKESDPDSEFYRIQRGLYFISRVLFTSAYDFSDYLKADLKEIEDKCGSLESYAIAKKIRERDEVIEKAKLKDMKVAHFILVKCIEKGSLRYEMHKSIESVLISHLHGECMLVSTEVSQSTYIISDSGIYILRQIYTPSLNKMLDHPTFKNRREENEWCETFFASPKLSDPYPTKWFDVEWEFKEKYLVADKDIISMKGHFMH